MQRMGKKSEFFLCWVFVYLILIFRVSSLILCGRLCCWFPNALYEKALSQHSVHTVTQSPADLWYAPLGNYKNLFQSWNDSSTLSQGMCKGSFHLHMHEVNRVVKYSALSRKASRVITMTDFWMLFYPELFLGGIGFYLLVTVQQELMCSQGFDGSIWKKRLWEQAKAV